MKELIGEKSNLEFCSLEQGWKEDAFRPSASFIGTLSGEESSKSIACDVPRRNDIIEDNQLPSLCTFTESWCRGQAISVERSMMLIVAFTDDDYDVWTTLFCHLQNRQVLHACFQSLCFISSHAHEVEGLNAAIIGGKEFRLCNGLCIFALTIGEELQHFEQVVAPSSQCSNKHS